jgi:hypothetical protein
MTCSKTAFRIYTKENLTLSPGPASGAGGHVEVLQPRGTAFLDLRSSDDSTASGAQINLRNRCARPAAQTDSTTPDCCSSYCVFESTSVTAGSGGSARGSTPSR